MAVLCSWHVLALDTSYTVVDFTSSHYNSPPKQKEMKQFIYELKANQIIKHWILFGTQTVKLMSALYRPPYQKPFPPYPLLFQVPVGNFLGENLSRTTATSA
jgi:hypothetical protein